MNLKIPGCRWQQSSQRISILRPIVLPISFCLLLSVYPQHLPDYLTDATYVALPSKSKVNLATKTISIVDPSGVVYDSISREPVAGVILNLVNASGEPVHETCLGTNQQSQVTKDGGMYAFDLFPGAHRSCPFNSEYRIEIAGAPAQYHANFSSIIRHQGAGNCADTILDCPLYDIFDSNPVEASCTLDSKPDTDACEIQVQAGAPDLVQDTRYFVAFEIESGDVSIIHNHIPVDARINNAQLLLSKQANRRNVSAGGLVTYTIQVENTKNTPALDITLLGFPPPNFSLSKDSVQLIQSGLDGELGTGDDIVSSLSVLSQSPITLQPFDFLPHEKVQIIYTMRVGVGIASGRYPNQATTTGPNGPTSNSVTTFVNVVADPVLDQATLVGRVFHDRDEDGTQDSAHASGLVLNSAAYDWNNLHLPDLPGRISEADDPANHAIIVNLPISHDNRFYLRSNEGSRISVDEKGFVTEAHVGARARGLNSQDIRICTHRTTAVTTIPDNGDPPSRQPQDVLQIVISNVGINEEGIPGVRLATVTGLVIETDVHGRFSIPDVDAGPHASGQNFVLKVDSITLPTDSYLTTQNPYVLRILNSSLNKIDFGVKVRTNDNYLSPAPSLCRKSVGMGHTARQVQITLGSTFFNTDSHTIRADQSGIVSDIVKKLRHYGSGEIRIESTADSSSNHQKNLQLADKRAQAIRSILHELLGSELMEQVHVEVITTTQYKVVR